MRWNDRRFYVDILHLHAEIRIYFFLLPKDEGKSSALLLNAPFVSYYVL